MAHGPFGYPGDLIWKIVKKQLPSSVEKVVKKKQFNEIWKVKSVDYFYQFIFKSNLDIKIKSYSTNFISNSELK